jgi:hypothetical protein
MCPSCLREPFIGSSPPPQQVIMEGRMITPDAYRELQGEIQKAQQMTIRILLALNDILSHIGDAELALKVKGILYPEGEEGSGNGTDQTTLAP